MHNNKIYRASYLLTYHKSEFSPKPILRLSLTTLYYPNLRKADLTAILDFKFVVIHHDKNMKGKLYT